MQSGNIEGNLEMSRPNLTNVAEAVLMSFLSKANTGNFKRSMLLRAIRLAAVKFARVRPASLY